MPVFKELPYLLGVASYEREYSALSSHYRFALSDKNNASFSKRRVLGQEFFFRGFRHCFFPNAYAIL